MAITYKQLKRQYVGYNSEYWDELRVLAHGGNILNRKMLEKLLPKSPGEEPETYKYRLNNAYFVPYLGSMLGYYASSVITDPIVMNTDDSNEKMPEYYEEFAQSVYRSGSFTVTANEHIRCMIESAFLTQTAYTLVDFPELPDEEEPPSTKLEEELLGMDQAYLCPIDACDVYNFREDDEGNLIWINIHNKIQYLENITDDQLTNIETFTIYYFDHWDRYTFKWKEKDRAPRDTDVPTLSTTGKHSFGSVPVVRMQLPDTLYFGDKIGSLAKKVFQKMNALDYSSDKSLFQMLLVKLAPPRLDGPDPIAQDADRGTNQILGAGRAAIFSKDDEVSWMGASNEGHEWTQQHIAWLRDEMMRIIGQSALSLGQAPTGSKIAISAASKAFDRKAIQIILEHLGIIGKDYMEEVFDKVAAGRGEGGKIKFRASGLCDYEQLGADEVADIQLKINSLDLPSATFKADIAYESVKLLLEGHPAERMEIIEKELQEGYAKQVEQQDEVHDATITPNEPPKGAVNGKR